MVGNEGLQQGRSKSTRVLVIDDEPLVARVMHAMLQTVGGVETSATLEAAIAQIESGSVDVILCDLALEGASGAELHDWLSCHRPELLDRLGFTTGGATTSGAQAFLSRVQPPTLFKPFTRNELLEFVDGLIDRS